MVSNFMGCEGFIWFMGIVENRNDPLKTGRVQCRAFAWDTASKALLPTEQLLWSHPILPINNDKVQPPKEGTMVFGFYMDGLDRQVPMIMGQVPGIPDTTTDPSQGFSDPRSNEQLQSAPRPPQSVTYNTSGSGATIQEAPNANRNPIILNEPTASRLTRNENIEDTIVQQKINSVVTQIPAATGALEVPGIDVQAFLSLKLNLPTITIPPFAIGINKTLGFEICGIGIGATISAGFSFNGITLGIPTITISGEILIDGLAIEALIEGLIIIGDAVALAIDIAGCLLAGTKIGAEIMIDGGILLPLLDPNKIINFKLVNRVGTLYGGVSLGTVGGIPASSTPMWDEPMPPYNAIYPYNQVHQTESGHVIEVDDTPGAERIHTFHRSGTFQEMHPDGSMMTKVTMNNYGVTMADHNLNVMGSQHTTINTDQSNMVKGDQSENIQGTSKILVNSDKTETVLGNETKLTAKNLTQTVTQDRFVNIKGADNILVEKNRNITILGNCNITVKGDCTLGVAGTLTIGSTGDTNLIVGGNFNINVNGTINEIVKGSVIETITGGLVIDAGSVTSKSDIIAGEVSVETHEHSGVSTGPGISGPPIT